MKRSQWFVLAAACLLPAWSALSGPLAGCSDIVPPGEWSYAIADGDRAISLSSTGLYRLSAASASMPQSDPSGQWDLIEKFTGGSLLLQNSPATPWFSPCDAAADFWLATSNLVVKLRADRYAATNAGYMEVEVVAQGPALDFHATYSGTPTVTNVPETADTIAYTLASDALDSAHICLGQPVVVDIRPGPGPNPLNVRSRGVLPVVIRGSTNLNVMDIDPSSIRLQCVPALRAQYEDITRDGIKDLVLKFSTQSIVANLPSDNDREVVSLTLVAELKNGTAVSGVDKVTVLNKGKPKKTPPGHARGQTNNHGRK
jgi:hypothetical protein